MSRAPSENPTSVTGRRPCERACKVGKMNFTYTGETISSADSEDLTVEVVTDAEGKAGHLASGRSRHGHGEIRYDSGAHYVGGWVRGKRCGTGKFVFPNGAIYEGEFVKGKKEGKAKYSDPSGAIYEGQFVAGKREGFGKYTDPSGAVAYQGEWKDGQPANL